MKNVYMVQSTNSSEGSYMLPYSVGTMVAHAWSDPVIKASYAMKKFIIFKEDVKKIAASLEDPFLVGFSNNLWNCNFNHALAAEIKKLRPDCLILFGGKVLPLDCTYLRDYPYIDFLIYLWGEEPFRVLLSELLKEHPNLASVGNLGYRDAEGNCVVNPISKEIRVDLPSPYLSGTFDDLMKTPNVRFVAGFETNRGCPFKCTYCDWDTTKSAIAEFPMDKIFAEIEWIAAHKIDYCGCFDSNFGILPRDEMIADKLVEVKARTGFPHKLQVSAAKADSPIVFNINKKLNNCGMSKGVTLSMQTLNPEALKNIDRQNISLKRYSELMKKYKLEGIPTFTDIILGLPGETYESFCRGLCDLVEAGQNQQIFIYCCNLLTNSLLWNSENVQKFGIETVNIPFSQFHCDFVKPDEIEEYSEEIIATSTMNKTEFINARLFGHSLQCFHCFGLLQCIAIYLFYEKKVPYYDFYMSLKSWVFENPDTVSGRIFRAVETQIMRYSRGERLQQYVDPVFGNIVWPFEEGAFLEIMYHFDEFYEEIYDYLKGYDIDPAIYTELKDYQKSVIKYPGRATVSKQFSYDFYNYYYRIFSRQYAPLEKKANITRFSDPSVPDNWKDYSKFVVWFGRKGKGTVHTDIRTEPCDV